MRKNSHSSVTSRAGSLNPYRVFGLALAFWSLIAVLFASQKYVRLSITGQTRQWVDLISFSVIGWLVWAFLTPVVFAVARRIMAGRRFTGRAAALHVVAAVAFSLLHIALDSFAIHGFRLFFGDQFWTWWQFVALITFKAHVNLLIYGALAGGFYAWTYDRQLREQKLAASHLESQLVRAQLGALKAQIHPHFLFNVHHSILALLVKHRYEEAREMLIKLSDLLRLALEETGEQETSVGREFEFLGLYLDLEQIRFRDRLAVRLEAEPEALEARIPNLILQPLVENAIKHGVAPHSTAGRVEVTAKRRNGQLELVVQDSGPGMDGQPGRGAGEGIGLRNTTERLQQIYGGDYALEFQTPGDGGCRIVLTVPFSTGRLPVGSAS